MNLVQRGVLVHTPALEGTVNENSFLVQLPLEGMIHIYHIDAYRMESVAEFEALGFDEYCRPDSVVLVEWADKVMTAVEGFNPITVRLEHISENQRRITIQNILDYLSRI